MDAAQTSAMRRVIETEVWKAAEPAAKTEMLRLVAPGFAQLSPSDQNAVVGGLSQKFIPVQQPTVMSALQSGSEAPPFLGRLRGPDPNAGMRSAGPMGYYRPLPYEPVRDIAKGAGGILGGMAGFGYGPGAAIGVPLGAGMGAAIGGQAAELGAYAGRRIPVVRDLVDFGEPRDALGAAREMTTDAVWELAFFGGASALRPASRPLKTLVKSRIDKEAMERGEKMDAYGIPIGFQEASGSALARFTQPILGQLPGFIGPFRDAFKRRAADQTTTMLKFLDRAGPRVANEPEISKKMVGSARARMQHVHTVLDRSFNGLYRQMEQSGIGVSPATAKAEAAEYLENVAREAIPQVTEKQVKTGLFGIGGESMTRTEKGIKRVKRNTPGTRLAETILALPDHISAKEYRGVLTNIDTAIEQSKKSGYDIGKLVDLKRKLVETMGDNLAGDPTATASMRRKYNSLRAVWGQARSLAETPGAGRIPGRLAFREGEGRKVAEDLVFDASIRDFSPDSMVDLRRLMGDDAYKAVVSRRMETAIESARVQAKEGVESTFDAKKFSAAFGLDDPRGINFHAWKSALAPLGVKMKDVRDLSDALALANQLGEPRAQQLAKRRVALGGLRSGVSAVVPTAVGGAGVTRALVTFLGIRRWGRIVTDPKVLRELTREIREEVAVSTGQATRQMIDKSRASAARRLLVASAMNAVVASLGNAPEGVPNPINLISEDVQSIPVEGTIP